MLLEKEFDFWIDEVNKTENPDNEVIAYWFGLFQTEKGYSMYLNGSIEFDDEDDDWACNTDFEPKNKYFEFPDDYVIGKNWEAVLEDSLRLLQGYLARPEFKESIFKNAIAIAAGFDNGDLNRIK